MIATISRGAAYIRSRPASFSIRQAPARALWHRRTAAVPKPARSYFSDSGSERFFGDFFWSKEIIFCPAGGAANTPSRTRAVAFPFLPYNDSFALLSGRSVEPSSEMPANSPREREYDRISARKVTSVLA